MNTNESGTNMKTALCTLLVTSTLLPAAMLALTSCSSTSTPDVPPGERSTIVSAQKGVPGGVTVETFKTTATITGVDAATRQVSLLTADGSRTSFKAGPEVANFDQIHVGDHVKATIVSELAVYLRKGDEPADDGGASAVALAPIGAKPGMMIANTEKVTAKVTAIDAKHHTATLQFPGGKSKTFKVRKDVDVSQATVGQEVVIRVSRALAITVEK